MTGLLHASMLTYVSPLFVQLFKSLLENPALSNGNFASCINWDKIIDCLRQSLEGNCCV